MNFCSSLYEEHFPVVKELFNSWLERIKLEERKKTDQNSLGLAHGATISGVASEALAFKFTRLSHSANSSQLWLVTSG
jgi:hypothetical protein